MLKAYICNPPIDLLFKTFHYTNLKHNKECVSTEHTGVNFFLLRYFIFLLPLDCLFLCLEIMHSVLIIFEHN